MGSPEPHTFHLRLRKPQLCLITLIKSGGILDGSRELGDLEFVV